MMETKAITDLYINYGVTAVIIIAFFVLVFWVVKTSKQREDAQAKSSAEREERIMKAAIEREEKLYTIIDALSEQLPYIRETLARIETRIDKK